MNPLLMPVPRAKRARRAGRQSLGGAPDVLRLNPDVFFITLDVQPLHGLLASTVAQTPSAAWRGLGWGRFQKASDAVADVFVERTRCRLMTSAMVASRG